MPIYNTDLNLTLSFDGWESDLPITVIYNYTPFQKGAVEPGTGIPLDPDIPESVTVVNIDKIVSAYLTEDQIAAIEEDILSDLQEN
jgi:hypothetical protein